MARTANLSLKAFWDALERELAARSDDELRAILRAIADKTAPMERRAFLDQLKAAKGKAASVRKAAKFEELLDDIDDLVSELSAQASDSEDYWEDDYGGGDYYDDEDSLGSYAEFVKPLAALFDRAEAAFDYGNLDLARAAYRKLFEEALRQEDDYGRGVRVEDLTEVDSGEACARYLRAVYETEPLKRRPKILFEQMLQTRSWVYHSPTFDDLIQISPKPLPEQELFLDAWIAYLRKQSGQDADAWLREAIGLAHGAAGLAELARTEGQKHPRAYLDWIAALQQEGQPGDVLAAAHEALQKLPLKLPLRATIADQLCEAADQLDDTDAVRAGRWEAFAAKPDLRRLLDLWDVAREKDERMTLMRQAAEHLKEYLARPPRDPEVEIRREDEVECPAWVDYSVLTHAYLFYGDWEAARRLASRQQALGWSSSDNPQGLVVAAFLVLLSGKLPGALPAKLAQLWRNRLETSQGFSYWGGVDAHESKVIKRLEQAYAAQFASAVLNAKAQADLLAWCLDVANRRVDAIVGAQHRGSYDKAALLLAACAEALRARGDYARAVSVLNDARERYPRHRAFLSELDAATGQSFKRGRQ